MTTKENARQHALPPVPTHHADRSGFRRHALSVLILLAMEAFRAANAACVPAGTSHGDTIVCSGSQTEGVIAKSGDDSISILSGASISLTTPQSATGVDAGSGNDSVVNDGLVSVTVTAPTVAPEGKSATCSTSKGDSYDKSTSQAVGIAGGSGNDLINNRGTIAVQTAAASGTASPQCAPSHSGKTTGHDNHHDHDDHDDHDDHGGHPPVKTAAVSTGILGDNGNDQINNGGSLAVSASSDAIGTQVTAKGIVGGNGNDVIVNAGTMTVAASSTQAGPITLADAPVLPVGNRSYGSKGRDISETGSVSAVGIEGGSGNDVLRNDGAMTVNASASITSVTPTLTLAGGEEVVTTTTVETRAIGIDAGAGRDHIANGGTLTVNATSEVTSVNAELNLIDLSHGDASTFVNSHATGIDGGSGGDSVVIANTGTASATATSKSTAVNVEVNAIDAALADAALHVDSTAVGINAGRGKDQVNNAGTVKATANSQVTDVGVNASFVDVTITDRAASNVSTTLNATAVGIDSAQGKDGIGIAQTGSVEAAATSNVHSVGVSLASEGVPSATETLFTAGGLASIGINSNSRATGIAAGDGADYLQNAGNITATSTATARQESINVGVAVFDFKIPTPGLVLGSAGTGAHADAFGIDAGRGDNTIQNDGNVQASAGATAAATTVSVNIAELSVDLAAGVPGIPFSASLVVADTVTAADATASGIKAGSGDDSVTTNGTVAANANATSGSTSAAATLNMKFKEGESFLTLNAVGARSTTKATATAAGVDTGSGDNVVYNTGTITAGATADANTVSIAVDVAGTLKGAGGAVSLAATDTSSTGTAAATGIQAGGGDDNIINAGTTQATATADVDSVSASAAIGIAKKGLVADVGLTRAESIATASATGIDGGGGNDKIENAGTVGAKATANAAAVAVSVTVEGTNQGMAGGAALADTHTTANATAIGIKSGSASDGKDGYHKDDHRKDEGFKHYDDHDASITNANAITVDAEAKTLNVSAGVNVGVAKEGVAIGAALADSHSSSQATATGIEGNSSANDIRNTGAIALKSDASSTAVSVSVNVAGTTAGLAAGAALVRADVDATSNAIGIDGGAGDDRLSNDGSITFEKSKSAAIAVGVAPNVVVAKSGAAIGGALADTRATANSTATALDGGAGDDQLKNHGTITLNNTTADSNAVSVSANIALSQNGLAAGAALARSDNTATARAQGLNGGSGDDFLLNKGSISLKTVGADADAVSVSIGVAGVQNGVALGGALVDAHAKADATGIGIAGGDGRDALVSTGSVTVDDVHANSDSVGVSVGVGFSENGVAVGAALAKTGTEANAIGKALDGGAGNDLLYTEGTVLVKDIQADATAVSVSVGASGAVNGLAIAAGLADASGRATSSATALDGGASDDAIVNRAKVDVQDVNAYATAVGVSVELAGTSAGVAAGATLVNSSGTATATAKGIDGGSGDDELWNKEALTVQRTKADANAVSTGVSIGVAVTGGVAGGAALSNATATANANATGMDGGSGHDAIRNVSSITLSDITSNTDAVGVSVELAVTTAGVALGAALADTSTTANTTAKGMDGGSGDDLLYNGGSISLSRIKADANAVSVGVSGNLAITGGVAAGAALTDGSGTANVTAVGMDGGSGRDKLVNTGSINIQDAEADAHATGVSVSAQVSLAGGAGGAALTDTSGTARTVVKGMDGGTDNDTIYNKGTIDVRGKSKADATSVDISVNVALGVGGGAQIANTSTTAETTTMGIDGGGGRDTISNEGSVAATAEADSQSTSVAIGITVAIGGDATIADARSTATATAIGINDAGDDVKAEPSSAKHEGHHGDHGEHGEVVNEIGNSGAVTATATATSKGVAVSGNLVGYALGETTNTATANATAIKTGDARDVIRNEGALIANSSATVSGLSVGVSLIGKAMGDASSTATATATAIDTGAGDDRIENLAALSAGANSQASAIGVSVGLAGVSSANASTTATATATGLNSGSGKDQIANHSTITVTAGKTDVAETDTSCNVTAGGACARVSSVSVNLAGSGTMNASTSASATAIGIAAGADDDAIDSDGAIDVSAHAKTGAGGANVNIAGATNTNVTSTANAQGTGIAGEDGDDVIKAAASITAKASSDIVVNATGVTIAGAGAFDATLSASARATAIDGGAGKDRIHNQATLSATAAATLNSGGSSNVIFGASGADSQSGAITDAAGIRGAAGDDFIWNEGSINTHSNVSLSLGNSSFTFGGAGGADGTLTATSRSTGIAGDDGHDAILSSNTITVDASSALNASGGSTVIFGASSGSATSGASTTAIGIDGGAHGDGILVDGSLTVTAHSQLTLSGSSFTFGGSSGAGGSLSASTLAIGVAGGTGADAIFNKGDVSASADSNLNASGRSDVAFGASTGGASAGAITDARGLDGGDDSDFLHNSGNVTATATATLTLGGGSFTFGGAGGTQGALTATTRSTGIAGGAGQDIIKNDGEIHSTNSSTLNSSGGSKVAFGTSGASSSAGAVAGATGIDGGDGNDFVWNAGAIFVNSTANLGLGGSSYTFGGTGDVGGRLSATTNSAGIQGGNGNDFIGNEGNIAVDANSTLTSNASVNTTFGTSASGAVVGSDIGAAGIDGSAGDDAIKNLGTVTANATASVDSGSSSYVFGGTTSTHIVAQAGANSAGLRGGDGNDFIFNSGDVTAEATATATSAGNSNAEFGGSTSRGEMAASLIARGVDGGAGDDVVVNVGTISAKGTSNVSSSHNTDTGFLFGDGNSVALGSTSLNVYGIDAGEGSNGVLNKGAINVDLLGSVSVTTRSDGGDIFDGDAYSRSDSTLTATAVGIRTGDGNDWIENKGSVDIKTWRRFEFPTLPGLPPLVLNLPTGASADANADGDGIDGDGTIRSFATTNLTAVGIDAGNGTNHVENHGTITLDARAKASATGTVDSDAGGSSSAILEARVNANAVGIRTGSGNDYVINKGTISVTTTASNNTGSAHINASATGIETGAGNDAITNEGTITATTIVNGVTASGTAIRAGTGDDVVKLTNGSVTNGNIDLGTGNNQLILEGTPLINGTILDGTNSLGLVFNGAGSFSGALPGLTATKDGSGTFTLSMLNKMQRIEVNQGTLKLDNDYTLMSGGMFQAKVNGNGSYGQLYVNGRAGLDGTMTIVRGGGAYVNGAAFDVLKARDGIQTGTAFSRVELPADTRLLKFHSEQLPDSVVVKADVASFTTVAGTTNQMAVAKNLDRILPTTSGSLNQLLGNIQALPEGQFASAFASMSPAVYAGYSSSTFNSMQQYTNMLQDRMTVLRASDLSPTQTARAWDEPIRLAYAGAGLSSLLDGQGAARALSSGLWVQGFSQKGDQDATDGMNGYNYRLTGTTFGFDRRFTNSLSAGVSLGIARNNVTVDGNVSQGYVDSTTGSVYAGYFDRQVYLNGALSVGFNKYDTHRTNVVDQSTISSSHDGDVLAATLGAGYYVQLAAWSIEPFATLQYTHLKEKAFSETGNGALNLPTRTSVGLVSTLGARLSRPIQGGNGATWIPQASLAWLHDYSNNQVINASYVDAPDSSFTIDGQPIQRNGALVGLGMNYRTQRGFTWTIQYNGEFRDQFRAHGIAGEFRFEF